MPLREDKRVYQRSETQQRAKNRHYEPCIEEFSGLCGLLLSLLVSISCSV